jgi:hypothetical protein
MIRPLYIVFFSAFGLAYFFIENVGLFADYPLSFSKILHSKQILVLSTLMLIVMLASVVRRARSAGIIEWLQVIAVVLLIAGLWVSYLTRFSGEVVVTEGQTIHSSQADYLPETFYRGMYAKEPDIGLKLVKLDPVFSEDGKAIKTLSGNVQIIAKNSGAGTEHTLTEGLPELINGSLLKIRDFGYSPRYVLKSKVGRRLDSSFMYMRLFPSGAEDNFRLLSPLTYYVRYYTPGSNNNEEPLIGLRIVRNKDVVFNDNVKLNVDVPFENSKISFAEVRMWTKLKVTHDLGLLPAIAGMILGLVYIAAACIRAIRK